MKIISQHDRPGEDNVHVMVLDTAELAAIRHALVRFAMEPMDDIEAEHNKHPESPLWDNWRKAQGLDLALRGYGL